MSYLHFYSQKSIQDQFIDDCLQFDFFSNKKCDDIPTDLIIASEKSIEINEFASQKSIGRWTVQQSFIYLETIKNYHQTKFIIKTLLKRLPQRIEPQIRAHHQKMIRKYGSIQNIIRCLDRKENPKLIEINNKLSLIEQQLAQLIKNCPIQ